MKNTIKYITLLSLGLLACEPEFDQPVEDTPAAIQQSGDADFSTFVALGDSLTEGIADGALYIDSQTNCFANMIATQMKAAGGGEFTTNFMSDNFGGFAENPVGFAPRFVLDAVNLAPVTVEATPTTSLFDIQPGPYNNMGVAGAKSFHLGFSGYGNVAGLQTDPATANPYYVRKASASDATIITDALQLQPTFFTLWIGANDVLSYATSGGTGVNQLGNGNPLSYGGDDITDPTFFASTYGSLVGALAGPAAAGGAEAKGLLVNIPAVTSLPFFTTVPYNAVPMDAATAAATNSAYAAYNGGLLQVQAAINAGGVPGVPAGFLSDAEIAKRTINFSEGQNAVVIIDESLTDLTAINPALISMRQATASDLLVLTSSRFIGTQEVEGDPTTTNGVAIPLADKWVLTPEEQAEITTATEAFNTTIQNTATAFDLAIYDASSRLKDLADGGISVNGSLVTNAFASGGFFSLDGIHLSPKGNGITANEMIETINKKYGSTLQPVETRDLPGVYIK